MPARLAAAALAAVLLAPASSRTTTQAPAPDFTPIAFLAGHCWTGTFPDGKATDEHCFEWVFGGKFLRDRHVVRNGEGPYQGETIYGWDPARQRIAYWYFNSEGQVVTGTVEPTTGGITFPSRLETPKGPVNMKADWTLLDGGYRATESQQVGGTWKALWTVEYRRTS